jgi:molybdenum cofactor synthesis domain-containing protein
MGAPNAAILIIGNEILSGRTLDVNTQFIATKLAELGIDLYEVRVIGDYEDIIVKNVNELRQKYSYLFTTGGIGPTHDDITVESIAKALGAQLVQNETLKNSITSYYAQKGEGMNSAREKMTYIPKGSRLLVNYAPSFMLENVVVMAGIPKIMQEMFNAAISFLHTDSPVHSKVLEIMQNETNFAEKLTALQSKYPDIEIGSYPFTKNNKQGASIVLKSKDQSKIDSAFQELIDTML